MAETKGADFMLDTLTAKAKKSTVKIQNTGELDIDAAVQLMDSKRDGEALRAGLDKAVGALEALKRVGLTGELMVLMVVDRAPFPRGAKHRLTAAQVEAALKGLFAIGEFVR